MKVLLFVFLLVILLYLTFQIKKNFTRNLIYIFPKMNYRVSPNIKIIQKLFKYHKVKLPIVIVRLLKKSHKLPGTVTLLIIWLSILNSEIKDMVKKFYIK